MRITLADAHDLPDNAYISIRVGEARCQKRFSLGEQYDFPAGHRTFAVDIFEKVGSKHVSLADLRQLPCDGETSTIILGGSGPDCIDVTRSDGSIMKLGLRVAVTEDSPVPDKRPKGPSRHEAALEVNSYLDRHGLQKVLQHMVHLLIKTQPEDPVKFMTEYLQESKSTMKPKPAPGPPSGNDRSPPSSAPFSAASPVAQLPAAGVPPPVPPKGSGKGSPPGKAPPGKGSPPGKPPPGKPPPGKPAAGKPPPAKPPPGKASSQAKATGPALSMEDQLAQKRGQLRACPPPAEVVAAEKGEVDPAVLAAQEAERAKLAAGLRALAGNTTLGAVVADSVVPHEDEAGAAEEGLKPLTGGASASMLGQGRFASVVRCEVPVDMPGCPSMAVAAKRFAASPGSAPDVRMLLSAVPLSALRTALREAEALSDIGAHPNIVKLLGIVVPPVDVAEICAQEQPVGANPPLQLLLKPSVASLHRLLATPSVWESLGRYGQLALLTDVARGLSAMHSAGFAHLDIKSHNVLVDRQADGSWAACICDLGSCYRVHSDGGLPPAEGTAGWTAPEILDESPEHLRAKIDPRLADVFSFGVVIWEVVSGPGTNHPLNHLAGDAYVDALASGRRPLFASSVEDFDECLLAAECWQYEASSRPSIFKVVDRLAHRLAVLKSSAARAATECE